MAYSLHIGARYLRSKKRRTISVITFIAVTGVALGVAALLAVLSITSGFQTAFRNKVLGVNAHVLVMKYGIDFQEYRDVMKTARALPEVVGAGPFLINEMMLAKGDRLSGVLVKGVDPKEMPGVLDLPDQIVDGTLRGLRKEGAAPPVDPDNLYDSPSDWDWLDEYRQDGGSAERASDAGVLGGFDVDSGPTERAEPAPPEVTVSNVETASPDEVEALLGELADDDEEIGDEEEVVDDEWGEEFVKRQEEIDRQQIEQEKNLPGIVVGTTLAKSIGIGVGDTVKLVSPLNGIDVSAWAPGARTPRSRDFRVIGIFEAGFQEYDSRLVYVDLYEAQHFYNQGDAVTGVEMRLADLTKSRQIARFLERKLGGPFHTLDWAELNRNLFTALEIQKIMLSLVIATIICVAAFNVVATLIMIVLEKKREIAILKAMGATDRTVLGIFMLQGIVIGVVGTLAGLLIGGGVVAYLAAYEFPLDPKVYLIDHLPVVVSPMEFVVTTAVALGICAVSTVAPSMWAARMLPVEGLRYE